MLRHEDEYDVQAEDVERVEIERPAQLDKRHETLLLHVLLELPLYMAHLPSGLRTLTPDADSGDVQVVEINVENIVHSYKSGIGNSVHKMLVFSRTRPCEEHYKYRYILQPLQETE